MLINSFYLNAGTQGVRRHTRRSAPWSHFVLDDFIVPEEFNRIAKEVAIPEGLRTRLDDPQQIQFAELAHIELAKTFLSIEFVQLIRKLTGHFVSINERNAIQLRRSGVETPAFPIHIDTPSDGKSLVAIYYVSKGWKVKNGGRLYLHRNRHTPITDAIPVEPLENRLVMFWTSPRHWHSVEKVKGGERYSILSEWMLIEN